MDLLEAQALWVLGQLRREDLPGIALEALQRGADSPSLRLLAGLAASDVDRAWELLESALSELGHVPIGRAGAARRIASRIARKILEGEIPPGPGAGQISRLSHQSPEGFPSETDWGRYRDFIGLWDQYEDYPAGRGELEQDIIDRARELMEAWGDE